MADEILAPVETGTDDGFELETPDTELEVPAVEGEETDESVEGEETPEETEARDGRQTPDAVRKALKAFRDGSPEHAKAAKVLNDAFGHAEAYKAVFPKVADAQAAQATIASLESYGGVEGITTTLAEVEEIDAMLAAGDPACLDRLQEIAGEGLNKLAPEILNRMKTSNPDAYAEVMGPIVAQAVASAGVSSHIKAIWAALQNAKREDGGPSFKKENQDQAEQLIKDLFKWSNDLGTAATPAAAKANPADAALTAREKAVQAQEEKHFEASVGAITDAEFQKGLSKEFSPYFDKLKLNQSQKEGLVADFWAEVSKMCAADKVYLKNRNAAIAAKTRSPEKVAAIVNAKFSSIVSQVTKSVVTKRYPLGTKSVVKPAVKVAPVTAAQPGKPILVKELPSRDQIDFQKTTEDMLAVGIRVLKSGKVVKLAS